jgi:hypothetical protein
MSEQLQLTIVYEEPDEDGWIVASVLQVPGAHSQGRTREEARENVIDAPSPHADPRRRRSGRDERQQRTAQHLVRRVKRRDLERHLRANGSVSCGPCTPPS